VGNIGWIFFGLVAGVVARLLTPAPWDLKPFLLAVAGAVVLLLG